MRVERRVEDRPDEPAGGPPPATGWRLRLLGGCRLQGPDGLDRTPVGRKTRGILGMLALVDGAPVSRERLVGLLWPERAEEQARGSLRQSLRELRGCLADPRLLSADRDRVALDTARIEVDALRLVALSVASAPSGPLLELCEGELLEGLGGLSEPFDAWLAGQRARWRGLALEALERRLAAADDPLELREVAGRMLALEPAHEPAHRALMLLHARQGDTAAAIRQFEACREALARRLDARPSEPTTRLLAGIRAGIAALAEPPPAAAAAGRRSEAVQGTSLVVLPLREQGGPGGLPPLGEGLAEEISAALARFRWILVLAPSSAAVLGREVADPLAIARRLEARYMVDGRVSHGNGQLRVRIALVDATTGRLLSTEHETLEPTALAELPSGLATAIAARLARELVIHESARAGRRPGDRADAHLLVLRSVRLVYALDPPELVQASELLRRALALDPAHAGGHAWLAMTLILRAGYPWRIGHAELFAEARAAAERAVQLDPADAVGLVMQAHCCAIERAFDQAVQLSDRALATNPGLPMAWARRALLCCYLGEPQEALARMAHYRRLSPFDPFLALFGRVEAFAHLLAGRFETAAAAARRAIALKPSLVGSYLPLLAALGHLGRVEEAAAPLAEVCRMEPRLSLEAFAATYPLLRPRDRDLYVEGLRRAGLRAGGSDVATARASRPAAGC